MRGRGMKVESTMIYASKMVDMVDGGEVESMGRMSSLKMQSSMMDSTRWDHGPEPLMLTLEVELHITPGVAMAKPVDGECRACCEGDMRGDVLVGLTHR